MRGNDRFKLLKKIAGGGQAIVWLAEDRLFGGFVAVKIWQKNHVTNEAEFERRLWGEAKMMAKLCPPDAPHKNVVIPIHVDLFEEGALGIVMEYIDGGSLADLLAEYRDKKAHLPLSQILDIISQVCDALDAAHRLGIIHRDIKPGNILYRRADSIAKLSDWGVAKNILIAGPGTTYIGTEYYMPKEILQLNDLDEASITNCVGVDHRADIYSLGVTMYHLVTLKTPFERVRAKILAGVQPEHRATLVSHLSECMRADHQAHPSDRAIHDLASIILKAMALETRNRYQSARELHQALEAWQDTHLISGELKAAWDLYNQKHDAATAERKFKEIMARHAANPQAFLELGRFYIQCSREDTAIEVLGKGIAVAPDFALLYNARGRLYAKRNSPLAIPDLQKALDLGLSGREAKHIRIMLKRLRKR
jgi:serine/threonine protein kinase